jgi:hypothetical protein
MAGTIETAIANGRLIKAGGFAGKFAVKLAPLWGVFGRAFETEVALRRPFLWLPVAAGTGVVLISLRRSRTVPLAYRARGRVAWRSRLSCPREADRVFFPLRALRGFCGRTVGGPADGAGRGAGH